MEIEDARVTGLRAHPLVAGEPRIRFLCSAPLVTPDGHAVGAIVVIGSATIQFADYDIDKPTSMGVLSVDDFGLLELQLVFVPVG